MKINTTESVARLLECSTQTIRNIAHDLEIEVPRGGMVFSDKEVKLIKDEKGRRKRGRPLDPKPSGVALYQRERARRKKQLQQSC
ncbi:MAG TPA: hypothetical protein VK619_10410 [Pyrinomonadaceae bacterium]|nr:hypothetical protein [Pyrinomonadaceae bacterium]